MEHLRDEERRGTDSRKQKTTGAKVGPYLVRSGGNEQICLGGVMASLEDQGQTETVTRFGGT